ncbi:hypothetical protein [Leptospira stimsonii]|uniref:Lipoprotein n=1 Tax=Leptospira stimsonii TaxID=2202203 RepID=A0ABY2ND52_9LEPT|nr:hypothetical protein [Leptospira stimsonii]TGK18448.1 hypothetical protein EHO98_12630 [Leptospira stimsonii]TGM21912.1 hypothetical protein EHQ90_01895 [Leptospira stimsonii]
MKEIHPVNHSNSFQGGSFGILKIFRNLFLSLLILLFAVSCKPKQTEEEKSDELFQNLIFASILLNPCNGATRFSLSPTNINVPAGQSIAICADQNGTPTLTFAQAGSYKLTAFNGSQTHSSSKCNSNFSDFSITVKDPGNTLILTSSATGATLDINASANSQYTITVNGIASSSPYSCQGVRASISTNAARLTVALN